MTGRKAASAGLLAVTVPALIGTQLDPYEDRFWKIWLNGAIPLGIVALVVWSGEQLKAA